MIEPPIIRELKKRIAECRKGLLDILSEYHYINSIVQPRLIFEYDNVFGDLEFELHDKNRITAELDRRVELISIKIRRGEKLTENTVKFLNMVIKRELDRGQIAPEKRFSPSIHRKTLTAPVNKNSFEMPECEVNTDYELPQIYRQIVKKLHPDVVGESEAFKDYWDNIQDAYHTKDLNRLRLFHLTLCHEEDVKFNNIKTEEIRLRTEIRELEQNMKSQKELIENLKKSEPFTFDYKLDDTLWVARRKRAIKERIHQIDDKIIKQTRSLRMLTAGTGIDFKLLLGESGTPKVTA